MPEYVIRDAVRYRLVLDQAGSVRLVVKVDEVTGLVRFGARDYDAETGRWTARDPIGFQGEASNWYTYASNSPATFSDPEGLCQSRPSETAGCRANAMTPTPEAFWDNPDLRARAIAWERASLRDGRERGAYLYRAGDGHIAMGRMMIGAPYSGQLALRGQQEPPPSSNAIAEFHTHPNIDATSNAGPGGTPSYHDISRSTFFRIPSFVIDRVGFYVVPCTNTYNGRRFRPSLF